MRKKVGLLEAGNEYLGHLEARAFDPETVRNRTITLKQLRQDIAGEGDILLENITSKHVDRWRAAHPWAPTTANRKVAEVRSFFDWCRARGHMNANQDPFLGWRNERVPQASRLRIPVDSWDDMLDAAPHPLERAILACGLFLMARSSELATIQMKHLDLDASEVEVYRHKVRRYDTRALYDELVEERGYDGALRRVQTMLDHKHSMTTELYLGLDVDKVARNKALRGKPMFTRRQVGTGGNVVPFTRRDGTDG
jgi:site-specific recombinase XerD